MNIDKSLATFLAVCLLIPSIFGISNRGIIAAGLVAGNAELTGNVFDSARDADNDTLYDYLDVVIEVNVHVSGDYRIMANYLMDSQNSSHYSWRENTQYLDMGMQWINLSFYGPEISAGKFDVAGIGDIWLYDKYFNQIGYLPYAPLSRVYNYTEFDCGAVLTGNIYDKGIDTDGDGFFNILEVGVEMNVSDAATYDVYVYALYGSTWVYVSNTSTEFLYPGIQVINVSLDGLRIYVSRGYVSTVNSVSLSIHEEEGYSVHYHNLGQINYRSLSRIYDYYEFDPLAFLTGTAHDEGVDEDGDGLFDFLKISVEVNVTEPGEYGVQFQGIGDGNITLYEYQGFGSPLDAGLHLMNFTVYGPKIYGARVDPTYIHQVSLSVTVGWYESFFLEEMQSIPLPTHYHFTQFESHAFLTGKVSDRGVDEDGDGLFDSLEVGVEVNVTEAGTYALAAYGLAEEHDGYSQTVGNYQNVVMDLGLGVQSVNFAFAGEMIASYKINPTHVWRLSLSEGSYGYQLSYIETAALSRQYNYTEFNSPVLDIRGTLTVYPDATVEIEGLLNYTRMYPPNYYSPLINASVNLSTEGDLTTGSANGTILHPEYYLNFYYGVPILGPRPPLGMYPPYEYQFPFNSTEAAFRSEYSNGMLNAQLNATMQMPPAGSTTYPTNSSDFSLLADYANGKLDLDLYGETELPSYFASQLPFNITDITLLADYGNNMLSGNVTFHALSGFPLGDIIAYFSGNKTEVTLNGYVNVLYGDYFGTTFNETTLENMLVQVNSTYPGRGVGSLYNGTGGAIECTRLDTVMAPMAGPVQGARVDFNVTIDGNFTELLATLLTPVLFGYYASEETHSMVYAVTDAVLSSVDHASLMLNYFHGPKLATLDLTLRSDVKTLWDNVVHSLPPTARPEDRARLEALLTIANITAYCVENAHVNAEYSSARQELGLKASITANVAQLKNNTISMLLDTVPPQFRDLIESCINTTYCKLESSNMTCNYTKGLITFDTEWASKGDFKAETNLIKSCFIEYLNQTSPYGVGWQTLMFNATEVDITNLKVDIRQGEDWETVTFEGLKVHPDKDEIDPTLFKLYRFFNMTSAPGERLAEFENLGITVRGGSNGTHTVLLHAPSTVPEPASVSLNGTVMSWQNSMPSSLKDLDFLVACQEQVNYGGVEYFVPIVTNSSISGFNLDVHEKRISFNVAGTVGAGFCNITIPRALLYAPPDEWIITIDGLQVSPGNMTVTENADYVFICLVYSHSSHTITIEGTSVVAEFPPQLLPVIMLIVCLAAAIVAVKQRRRLGAMKTKYQTLVNMLVAKIH